ncbi:MAG: NAD(P)-dependent oxidoreductase [Desulfobacterales bacterium]|nr:MAG: NAD(P)-dependent oxidoreductase [Desulfobacterales bacterium]
MQIGFIGVGFMGYGIAHNLLKSGHSLRLIANRKRENIEKLVSQGAAEARDYAELLAGAEAVVSCVGTAEQIESVVNSAEGHLAQDALWIDCTTSRPQTAVDLCQRLKKRGVDFMDAPVTRGPKDAAAGRLISFVGADRTVFEKARPLIACYSESVTHIGPVGSALQVKLLNNFITMGQVALVVEAMQAADRAGIDRRTLYSILSQGAANSGTLQKMVPPALDGDYSGHAFSLGNGAKDVRYGMELLARSETGKIITEALDRYYSRQLDIHSDDTLLSQLLVPEQH